MTGFTGAVVIALGLVMVTLTAQAKHWAYETHGDEVGPEKWGTLPGDEGCGTGKQQTPINLAAAVAKSQDLPNLVFGYKPSKLSMTTTVTPSR
jgi:carbonic anhydrase